MDKAKHTTNGKEKIYHSCGNVFKDLGLPNPDRLLARSKIMLQIEQIIRKRRWTQQQAAKVLGISQSKVSCLMHGKFMFSLDHLLRFLNMLDQDIEIVIKPKANGKVAKTRVLMLTGISMREARTVSAKWQRRYARHRLNGRVKASHQDRNNIAS